MKKLIEFGKYLLSDERKNRYENNPIKNIPPAEDRLKGVTHADIMNFN